LIKYFGKKIACVKILFEIILKIENKILSGNYFKIENKILFYTLK